MIQTNQQLISPCFTESVESYFKRLEEISNGYSNACNVNSKPEIKALLDLSENLSGLENYASKPYSQVPSNYVVSSTYSDPNLNNDLSQQTLQVISQWQSGLNVSSQLNDIRQQLRRTIQDTCNTRLYPLFFMNNILKLSEYKKQMVSLRIMNESIKGQCLPSNWKYVTSIDYKTDTNQVVIRQDSTTSSNGQCNPKPLTDEVIINPVDLGINGVAISFWIKEDYSALYDNNSNILNGYINNDIVFQYNIGKSLNSEISHNFKVQNETRTIDSNSTCSQWVFVMISIQKDCDKYRLLVSLRFPGSNTRAFFEQKLMSNQIENIQFFLNKNNNVQFYDKRITMNFLYNFNNEMTLMNTFRPNDINDCSTPIPPCKYIDSYGRCLLCKKPYFWYNYQCPEVCPEGYFGRNGRCYKCFDGCTSCTGEYEDECKQCNSEMNLYLYKSKCIPTCPAYTYPTTINNIKVCSECNDDCEYCCGKDKCCQCKSNSFLYKNTCVKDCPKYYYNEEIKKRCNPCFPNCVSCTSEICKMCDNGLFIKDKKYCVSECEDGYFKNTKTYTCDHCIYGCKVCKEYGRCDVCKDSFTLKKNLEKDECVPKCAEGKILINGVCSDCSVPNCKQCSSSDTTKCIECYNDYFLKENQCVKDCELNFYNSNDSNGKKNVLNVIVNIVKNAIRKIALLVNKTIYFWIMIKNTV